jgi:hypothetical protein
MIRSRSLLLLSGLASCLALALVVRAAIGDNKPGPRPADPTKEVIEGPVKLAVAPPEPGQPLVETKMVIEKPTKILVVDSAHVIPPVVAAQPPANLDEGKRKVERPAKTAVAASAPAPSNPKVEPGKVTWHATFADACQAAAKSNKPVLLFQMMGKLDDQFC